MLGPADERTPPMTPQLALRVAIVGGVALVLFSLIFFRLWFLQILSGSQYVAEAQSNVVQHIPVAAPRGEIVDSTGTALVQSVAVPSIQIAPRSLPAAVTLDGNVNPPVQIPAKDYALFDRLATLIGMPTKAGPCQYTVYWAKAPSTYHVQLAPIPCLVAKSVSQSSYGNATIKTNVPTYIQDYLAERSGKYRGVLSQDTYVRRYALGDAGAQLFGSYGQITPLEVGTKAYRGIRSGNLVGQSGLEAQYNWALQGVNGSEGVKVNSQGQFEGYAKVTSPLQGDTLKLSLDAQLEKVGQQSLAESISRNGGDGGAFVAMNPQNGAVYAMGSAPTYDPSKVSPTVSSKEWSFLENPANGTPLLNRAINGEGPDGSTFKVITATAALESGVWSVDESYDDTGKFCFPNTNPPECKQNSGGAAYGPVALETAIQNSVDTFFYNLGDILNSRPTEVVTHPNGGALQQWAHRFGIGRATGIDLPGESTGSMASPRYFQEMYKLQRECVDHTGPYRKVRPEGGCHIADTGDWTVGDNVNAAVGQGDVQVTPLQLAVAYSALANDGKIVTPHLAQDIQSATGQVIRNLEPAARRQLDIQPAYLDAIRAGLRQAVLAGTSADVMGSFPQQVYGKTGTAQYFNAAGVESDYAWYACFVPATATSKPITVVVWVPKGGFGDVAAAPVARQILNQWFYGHPGRFIEGAEKTL